jgi:hypothetical protein
MANITRGHTFSSGDLVTATKLHNLVDDASVANIAEAALADGSHIITSSTTAPAAATAGHAWWDTSGPEADGYGILKIHDGTRWQSVAKNVEQYYFNRSGGDLTYGDLVIFDTSTARSVTTTTSAGSTKVAGVIASAADGLAVVADDSEGRVVRSGLVMVKTTGTVTLGDYLGTSDTVKLAKSLGSSQVAGAFGIAVKDTGTTDQWLVALSGHTVDYVEKTTTVALVENNRVPSPGRLGNNSATMTQPDGIPGTDGAGGSSTSNDGASPSTSAWLPLTWWDETLDAGSEDVVVESGEFVLQANQMVHVFLSDIAIKCVSSHSSTADRGIGLRVTIEASSVVGLSADFVVSEGSWSGLSEYVNPDDSTRFGQTNYITTGSQNNGVWFRNLQHDYSPTLAGTYKVRAWWHGTHSGGNFRILAPLDFRTGTTTFESLGMGKPTLKVVTR